jgi:hypothetical protein
MAVVPFFGVIGKRRHLFGVMASDLGFADLFPPGQDNKRSKP